MCSFLVLPCLLKKMAPQSLNVERGFINDMQFRVGYGFYGNWERKDSNEKRNEKVVKFALVLKLIALLSLSRN